MKAKYSFVWKLVILTGLLLIVVPNVSATVIDNSMESLAVKADSIVFGEVIQQESYWKDEKIYTKAEISVEICIKGDINDRITVEVPGGTVGDISAIVSNAPTFEVGQKSILFLKDTTVLGGNQGMFMADKAGQVLKTETSVAELIHDIKEYLPETKKGGTNPTIDVKELKLDKESVTIILPEDNKDGSEEQLIRNPSWVLIKEEGFEGAFPNDWTLYGDPTWCNTNYISSVDDWSGWCACGGDSGVYPGDGYPNDVNSWIVYGPFDLSDALCADLYFDHWTKTEADYDCLFYGASIDGENFYAESISGDWGGWNTGFLDLTNVYTLGDLCGQSQVWIAFVFYSDATITDEGVFLDSIEIFKDTINGDSPIITDITPDFGPAMAADLTTYEAASDSTQVTISGSNFGSTEGDLEFWRGGSYFVPGTIESWNDNQIVARVAGGASSNDQPDGSGNINVITSGGSHSNDADFRVTYSYGGGRQEVMLLTYYVNPNTADTTGELGAIQAAVDTWNNAGANFQFVYGGTTSITSLAYDGENSVIWRNMGDIGVLAYAWTYFSVSNPEVILENEIEFNDYYAWDTSGSPSSFDVQTIGTHEFGHWLLLLDLYGSIDSPKMMYGFGSAGTLKRDLHPDDIDGIIYIYGEDNLPIADAGGPYSGCDNVPISFYGSASGGTPSYSYHWEFGDGSSSDVQNPTYTYTTADSYTATLTVTDSAGGTDHDTADVTVDDCPDETMADSFGVNDASGATGSIVPVPLEIVNVENGPIQTITFEVGYDESVIMLDSVDVTLSGWIATLGSDNHSITMITFDQTKAIAISYTGSVGNLNFQVIGNPGDTCSMTPSIID
ncbi:MAG: PKD domain-containing protein, partial [ANME-2 cluster archaeon]|nr:PKD domain-containing protein [ANME-2 cluster archaeon]